MGARIVYRRAELFGFKAGDLAKRGCREHYQMKRLTFNIFCWFMDMRSVKLRVLNSKQIGPLEFIAIFR